MKDVPARKVNFSSVLRVGGMLLLVILTLFYLQFGLAAIRMAPSQGVMILIATAALGLGTYRMFRRKGGSGIVFLGTLPLFLYHIPYTVIDPGEMPFLIVFAVVPALAGLVWLLRRWMMPQPKHLSQ